MIIQSRAGRDYQRERRYLPTTDDGDVTAIGPVPIAGDTDRPFCKSVPTFCLHKSGVARGPARAEALIIINATRINEGRPRRVVTRPAAGFFRFDVHYRRLASLRLRSPVSSARAKSKTKFLGNERKAAARARDAAGRASRSEIPLINLINAPSENKLQVACRCASF